MDISSAFGALGRPASVDGPGAVRDAAVQFERVFAERLFSEFANSANTSLFGSGPGAEIYQSMFTTEIARSFAEGGELGLAESLAEGLGRHQKFRAPVAGPVSSRYGQRTHPVTGEADHHDGVDIAVPEGTEVSAPFQGRVVDVREDDLLGRAVVVSHYGGYTTVYGHLSEAMVEKGDHVSANAVIGRSGSSGRSSGPHLHFGLYRYGRPVDPGKWVALDGKVGGGSGLTRSPVDPISGRVR